MAVLSFPPGSLAGGEIDAAGMSMWSRVAASWGPRLDRARRAEWLWRPVLAVVVTRLGILAVAYFSAPLVADSAVPPYHLFPDNILLDTLASRWDTGFYLSIAKHGYEFDPPQLSSVAFFPLLPILMRGLGLLTGNLAAAGLLVVNLALVGAAIVFYRLGAAAWGGRVAERAVWYWLLFPTAFFGSAIYTESLFLLSALLALYLARQGRWGAAGLAGLLAALSRFMGLIVWPLLVVEWFSQRRAAGQRPAWSQLASTALVPLGTGAYLLYLQLAFGDALAFMRASAAWGRAPAPPAVLLGGVFQRPAEGWLSALAAGRLPLDNLVDLGFVLVFVALGIGLLARRRWSEGVFVLLGCVLPLGSGLLMSQRRYVWVLFPAFVLLAQWGEKPWFDRLVLIAFSLGLGVFTALFANWYWVG